MRNFLALLGVAVCVVALSACAAKEGKWDSDSASYAAYATQIPLYPGTKIKDQMGSESWGDEPDSYSYGMTWWCETAATREKVVAFYEERLPKAERTVSDGDIELKVVPAGAQPGEDMGVWIGEDGKYRVFESRKTKEIDRKKHTD